MASNLELDETVSLTLYIDVYEKTQRTKEVTVVAGREHTGAFSANN